MKRFLYVFAFVAAVATVAFVENRAEAQTQAQAPQTSGLPQAHRKMLTIYCVGCHNSGAKIGGLALDGLTAQAPTANAATWEKALKKLRKLTRY